MHQITAYGSKNPCVPFQQAIPQSPGFQPFVSNHQQEGIFQDYLALLGVSTVEEARGLPYSDLVRANAMQVGGASYGQYVYGPTVDGDFVPAMPGELMLNGQYAKNLKVMVGHNANEVCVGLLDFGEEDRLTHSRVSYLLRRSFKTAPPSESKF